MIERARTALFFALVIQGCGQGGSNGDAGGHYTPGGACEEIADACHTVDVGTGRISECHDVAHDGPVAACEPIRAECVALCEAAASDGGATDGGATDGGPGDADVTDAGVPDAHAPDDGGHDESDGGEENLCAELGSLCHAFDTGAGTAHECHELGHDGALAECEAREAECRAACSGDAGPRPTDAGSASSG